MKKSITVRFTMDELFAIRDALVHAVKNCSSEIYRTNYQLLDEYIRKVIEANKKD